MLKKLPIRFVLSTHTAAWDATLRARSWITIGRRERWPLAWGRRCPRAGAAGSLEPDAGVERPAAWLWPASAPATSHALLRAIGLPPLRSRWCWSRARRRPRDCGAVASAGAQGRRSHRRGLSRHPRPRDSPSSTSISWLAVALIRRRGAAEGNAECYSQIKLGHSHFLVCFLTFAYFPWASTVLIDCCPIYIFTWMKTFLVLRLN